MCYRRSAEKGEAGYSEKGYTAPHYEGDKTIGDMQEWVSWYCFNKLGGGIYEAELDEAWYGGSGHNDGGTINVKIPEEWFALPYDEFLSRVITLAAAKRYGFTAEELKEKTGLKEFFRNYFSSCNRTPLHFSVADTEWRASCLARRKLALFYTIILLQLFTLTDQISHLFLFPSPMFSGLTGRQNRQPVSEVGRFKTLKINK